MADEEPRSGPGQELLAAYRVQRGPSPAAVERIAAALREQGEVAEVAAIDGRRRWWIVAGVGLAAAIGLLALRSSLVQREVRREDAAAKFERASGAEAPVMPREVGARAPEEEPVVVVPEVPVVKAKREPVPVVQAPREPSLAEEMQHMRAAQAALAGGDTAEVLRLLEVYVQTFPGGRLHEEYLALRAIALCTAGPPPAGVAEAEVFLAGRPRSMFAARVRGACGR